MALELEGRIVRKLGVQTGTSARGAWSKQEFVFEYQEGNFPTQVCMNVWGEDKVRELDKYQVNDKVKVSSISAAANTTDVGTQTYAHGVSSLRHQPVLQVRNSRKVHIRPRSMLRCHR